MADEEAPHPRTLQIHGTLQLEPTAVEARLKKMEEKLDANSDKGAWAWILDVLKTLLPSIVLAVLGFALKDTVDQALREREIQLEAVKEMEKLVPDLQKTDLVRPEAQAKAAQLAAFGRYSVPFFVNILEVGNQNAGVGAEDGLRMVARSEPAQVCAALQTVIQNRTGLYPLADSPVGTGDPGTGGLRQSMQGRRGLSRHHGVGRQLPTVGICSGSTHRI